MQFTAKALEGQAEERQRHLYRIAQRRLRHGRATDEGKAADSHSPRIHAEKLIIEMPRQSPPEPAVLRHIDPRLGVVQIDRRKTEAIEQ